MHEIDALANADNITNIEKWMVLRTAARWEKKIAHSLADVHIPVFLPTITKKTQYKSKCQTTELPLFSGYLFCSEKDFFQSSHIPQASRKQIAQILKPNDPLQLREELNLIAKLLRDHQLVQQKQYGNPNEIVHIVGGPLIGYEGKILRLKPNKHILILEVTFLGTRIEVEIAEHLLEKKSLGLPD